jgi:hypothetical protein
MPSVRVGSDGHAARARGMKGSREEELVKELINGRG